MTVPLSNRWQKAKINLSFSRWSELILLNLNDLFYFYLIELRDVCYYADFTTFHPFDSNLEGFIK